MPTAEFVVVRPRLFPCCHSSKYLASASISISNYFSCFSKQNKKERMKYGKIGWNINYEFNEFDFDGSFKVLNTLIGDESSICWVSVKYFLGEVSQIFTTINSKQAASKMIFRVLDNPRRQNSRPFRQASTAHISERVFWGLSL